MREEGCSEICAAEASKKSLPSWQSTLYTTKSYLVHIPMYASCRYDEHNCLFGWLLHYGWWSQTLLLLRKPQMLLCIVPNLWEHSWTPGALSSNNCLKIASLHTTCTFSGLDFFQLKQHATVHHYSCQTCAHYPQSPTLVTALLSRPHPKTASRPCLNVISC